MLFETYMIIAHDGLNLVPNLLNYVYARTTRPLISTVCLVEQRQRVESKQSTHAGIEKDWRHRVICGLCGKLDYA